jgi:hypothetical protein
VPLDARAAKPEVALVLPPNGFGFGGGCPGEVDGAPHGDARCPIADVAPKEPGTAGEPKVGAGLEPPPRDP